MGDGFGSDGFRGITGHLNSKDNIFRILLALDQFLRRDAGCEPSSTTIPIGYDTRFLARETAHFAARTLAGLGYQPQITDQPCPSPYLSFCTRRLEAPVGLQFTASHNPPLYGGLKLKAAHGGSMLPGDVQILRGYLAEITDTSAAGSLVGKVFAGTFNLEREYAKAVLSAAGGSGNKDQFITVDFMHGATASIYRTILDKQYMLNHALRDDADPYFGGIKPEPLPANLKDLALRVGYDGHDSIGLAFDGDGDRLAVVDETGAFLAPHEIFCILLEHTVATNDPGPVVGTVSFSNLVRRCAADLGCSYHEVPVGYKSVSKAMLEHQAIIGGEESGGTGFGHYLPERDALLMAMSVLAARQRSGMTLHEMVEDLYARHGRLEFTHRDVEFPRDLAHDEIVAKQSSLAELGEIGGDKVVTANTADGSKLITDSGWVLVRMSGTEPLVRIYAESTEQETTNRYISAAMAHLGIAERKK